MCKWILVQLHNARWVIRAPIRVQRHTMRGSNRPHSQRPHIEPHPSAPHRGCCLRLDLRPWVLLPCSLHEHADSISEIGLVPSFPVGLKDRSRSAVLVHLVWQASVIHAEAVAGGWPTLTLWRWLRLRRNGSWCTLYAGILSTCTPTMNRATDATGRLT